MSIRQARASRGGFSLIEVLIAVFVLALGLLGLGAVFPMVVREQRIATQTTLGLSAQNAIDQILPNNQNFRPGGNGWAALREYVELNGGDTGDWVAVEPEESDLDHLGSYILPDPDGGPDIVLPLSQRLYPLPYSTANDPRFVWDLAARFTGDPRSIGYPDDSPLLVALFLRPIDPGIKTPFYVDQTTGVKVPYSVLATLLDTGLPGKDRRLPVSVDGQGRPTLDGHRDRGAHYATPIVATVLGPGTDPTKRLLVIDDVLSPGATAEDVATALLASPGQMFLDSRGFVYTVTKVNNIRQRARTIEFTPAINQLDSNGDGVFNDDDYNPIVFLPMTPPVKPSILTLNP